MRTRDEIENEQFGSEDHRQRLLLEVLLDIRDLLSPAQIVVLDCPVCTGDDDRYNRSRWQLNNTGQWIHHAFENLPDLICARGDAK